MIHMERRPTGLYYVTDGRQVSWHWRDAPQRVRQAYRNRSDFWATAPQCVVKEWLNT